MKLFQNPTYRLAFQYLMPLVYAVVFYAFKVLPNEATVTSTILFLLGFYVGNLLLWVDGQFLYPFYNELRTEPKQLITRSAAFAIVFIVLALFVITSSGNYIGSGLIFGIGLSLFAEYYAYCNLPEDFNLRFLFQLKRPLEGVEIRKLVHSFAVAMVVLTILFYF
jgi:hypothetical protein